jgi:phosphoribosylanthranilate isomerase
MTNDNFNNMRIKICGIRHQDDAKVALDAGADALGFLVGIAHLAEDKIRNEEAKAIIESLPPLVSPVAVTHLTDVQKIIDLIMYLGVNTVQIHDYIEPKEVKTIRENLPGVKIITGVHVEGEDAIEMAKYFEPYAHAILLDSRTTDRLGGTGITHDWNISARLVKSISIPVILAGGLTPGNVLEAVYKVKPYGVDVNSGVEDIKGYKNFSKVQLFIGEARRAAAL